MRAMAYGLVFILALTFLAFMSGCSVTKMKGETGDLSGELKTIRGSGESKMTISKDMIWIEAKEDK